MPTLVSNVKNVVNRQAELEDVRAFNGLINNSGGAIFFKATFGQFNFTSMVENSCISLVSMAENANDMCLAYLSVTDSPGIGKEGDAFDKAIQAIREHIPEVTCVNSLFVNFLLLAERSDYEMDRIGTDLLANAFALYSDIDYVLWLCPSSVKLTEWTVQNFVEPESEALREACEAKSHVDEPLLGYRLLYAHRDNFFPKLLVRDARIEDNDDLLPILKKSAPGVFENQGNYFLADLVQNQDDGSRFFVGVSKHQPVGLIATSIDVNVGLITKVFNVDQYPDMFVAKVKNPPPPPLVIGLMGELRTLGNGFLKDLMKSSKCILIDAESMNLDPSAESKDGDAEIAERQGIPAKQMLSTLKSHIAALYAANPQESPPFCVVKGFPRNDAEAELLAKSDPFFDIVLQVQNELAENTDTDEVDDFLFNHLEAVEAYQSFLPAYRAPIWKKIVYAGPSNADACEDELADTFRELVLARVQELDAISQREDDEPPMANAFAVTVFCMKDGYESRADDLIRVVFEEHPALDYCMYMVPNNTILPNKLVGSMVATKLRTGMSFDQTLYVIHRESLLVSDVLCVDRALESNSDAVAEFLSPLSDKRVIDAALDSYKYSDVEFKDNPMAVSFEIKAQSNIIGLVVLSRTYMGNDDIYWLRSNFMIEDFVNFERHRGRSQAYISHFVISPVFSKWSRYIIREIMRKYMKTVLYFQTERDVMPPQQIIDELIAVPPRRRMQAAPGSVLPLKTRPTLATGASEADCPLFHLTKKDLSTPKTTVLKRVVVIGGSVASYALLEKLCFARNFNYPNIYLVADAIPVSFSKKGELKDGYTTTCNGLLSPEDADDSTADEMYSLGLGHRVHSIQGRLTDIDRANKAIIVSDELVVEYDLLVISSTTKDRSFKKFPATSGMHSTSCEKRGVFGIGDPATDKLALSWIQNQERSKWPVVIYGTGIDVIGAIGILMKHGVPSRRLTAVIPSEDLPENCHPTMNEAIIRSLRSSGVVLHRGFDVVNVQFSTYGAIEGVTIKNVNEDVNQQAPTALPCFSLICCNKKYCDPDVFTAINDCGIVYDGGIVVDKDFRTVDPSIYAVGDFTRFSRIYPNEPIHYQNNAREMGSYVGERLLVSHLHYPPFATEEPVARIPVFKYPRTASLPMAGGKHYVSSKLSRESHDANVLITGDVNTDRLCAVKIDSLGIVVEICYFGKSEIESKNISKLVGWHESYLNAALNSYEEGKVDDWVDFFRGDWATALYHDKFAALVQTIKSSLSSDKDTFTILDKVMDALDASTENDKVVEVWKASIGPRGEKLESNTKRIVETSTLEYLRDNKIMLNRFALPPLKKKAEK